MIIKLSYLNRTMNYLNKVSDIKAIQDMNGKVRQNDSSNRHNCEREPQILG